MEFKSEEQLRTLYEELLDKKNYIESDMKYTQDAIDDPKTNYLDKVEYNDDLTIDRMQLSSIIKQIEEVNKMAKELNIILVGRQRKYK